MARKSQAAVDESSVVSFGAEDSTSGEPVLVSPFDEPGAIPAVEPEASDDTFVTPGGVFRKIHEYRGKILIDRCVRVR
jgi:hypothetical protein